MARLDALLRRGLTATATLWPDIQTAYGWVHRAAHILANPDQLPACAVRQAYQTLLDEIAAQHQAAGYLAPGLTHFLKVSASYSPGLFHCYAIPDLPRTNNDLEHFFGRGRYLERRTTGRKVASASFVLRGPVRLMASVATSLHPFRPDDLGPVDRCRWTALRHTLDARHQARRAQLPFRHDPHAYLADLENQLLKPILPP